MNKLIRIFSYIEYLSLAIFMVLLGILAFSRSTIAGLFLILLATGTLFVLFYRDKRSFSQEKIMKVGDPLFNIVVDAILIGFCISDWDGITGHGIQTYYYLAAATTLALDLLIWILTTIEDWRKA